MRLNQLNGQVLIMPLNAIPRVRPGDSVAKHLLESMSKQKLSLEEEDIVVVTQKIVSKAEGRMINIQDVRPTRRAKELANELGKDPRMVTLVLREARRVVKMGHGVLITETHHGFVCANSGIDQSNVEEGYITLLPKDPDGSARAIRAELESYSSRQVAVIITDTFGRPWRNGQIDVAIGCSGVSPLEDLVGTVDPYGHTLHVTQPAIVDEVASASELVMRKHSMTPAALVRGLTYRKGDEGVRSLIRPRRLDLFR